MQRKYPVLLAGLAIIATAFGIFYATGLAPAGAVTGDTEPPQITAQTQAADEIAAGEAVLLLANVSDNDRIDYVIFETNETGAFREARRYNISAKDATVSMSWSNPEIKTDTVVGWTVIATDAEGNVQTSDIMAFKVRGCPVCPVQTDWSECESAGAGEPKQYQIYYECNKNTGFTCTARTRAQNCTIGVSRDEAKSALDAAASAIVTAKEANKDTTTAESLLGEAEAAYAKGEWSGAKAKAGEAETAAETAENIQRPGLNYLPYLAAVIVIMIALWMLLRFGKIHLPVAENFTPPPVPEPSKGAGQVCGVCGRPFPKLYTCVECGTRVCFDDARTWQGKIYCINDLRKKGLL